jgi:hypothetical protein
MAALMACALLRCCGDNGEQDDHPPDPGPPFVRLRQEQATPRASSTHGQTPSCGVSSAQHTGVDELDADVLMLILARCELQDLALSARVGLITTVVDTWTCSGVYAVRLPREAAVTLQGVCSLWRDLADQAALTVFKERWGLRSIVGKPRHPAALAVRLAHQTMIGILRVAVVAFDAAEVCPTALHIRCILLIRPWTDSGEVGVRQTAAAAKPR